MANAEIIDPKRRKLYPWEMAVIRASQGQATPFGCSIIAALGLMPQEGRAMAPGAIILVDGEIWTYTRVRGHSSYRMGHPDWEGFNLGQIETWVDSMRRVAEAARLSDSEWNAFFSQLKLWVAKDCRREPEETVQATKEQFQ